MTVLGLCGCAQAFSSFCKLELLHEREAPAMDSLAPQLESSPCSPQLEEALVQQQRSSAAKNK